MKHSTFLFILIVEILTSGLNVLAQDQSTSSLFFANDICIVSLGSNCRVSTWLKALKIRFQSFPFDWVESEEIDGLIDLISNDFIEYLNFENLIPYNNHYYNRVRDKTYKINFVHDFSFQGKEQFSFAKIDDFNHGMHCIKQEYASFFEKYQRRINRFRALSKTYKHIIFVRTRNVNKESSILLYNALKKLFQLYHESITLIVLNDSEEFKYDWGLYGIKNFYLPTICLINDGYEGLFMQILKDIIIS